MINLSLQSKDLENKLITVLVTQYNLVSGNLITNQNRGIRGQEDTKSKKNEKVILVFVFVINLMNFEEKLYFNNKYGK